VPMRRVWAMDRPEKFPVLDAPPQVRRVRRPQRQRSAVGGGYGGGGAVPFDDEFVGVGVSAASIGWMSDSRWRSR
jgi:hypothetical protein